jgi:hypothetical protein
VRKYKVHGQPDLYTYQLCTNYARVFYSSNREADGEKPPAGRQEAGKWVAGQCLLGPWQTGSNIPQNKCKVIRAKLNRFHYSQGGGRGGGRVYKSTKIRCSLELPSLSVLSIGEFILHKLSCHGLTRLFQS